MKKYEPLKDVEVAQTIAQKDDCPKFTIVYLRDSGWNGAEAQLHHVDCSRDEAIRTINDSYEKGVYGEIYLYEFGGKLLVWLAT